VTVRGFGRLDGDEGFAEVSSTTCSSPMAIPTRLAVASSATSTKAGEWPWPPPPLSGASPSAHRTVPGHGDTPHRLVRERAGGDPQLADAVVQGWIEAEAYELYTLSDVTRSRAAARQAPLEPEQTVLV